MRRRLMMMSVVPCAWHDAAAPLLLRLFDITAFTLIFRLVGSARSAAVEEKYAMHLA